MMMKASVLIAFFAAAVRAFEVTAPSCIDIGSDVTINFNSTRPKNGDWIGLMPVTGDELTSGVAEPLNRNWIWTCGSQSCESSPSTGTVKLLAPTVTDDNRYIAYLARNGVEPYRVKAVSGVINVKISCSQSTSAPLAQPVSGSLVICFVFVWIHFPFDISLLTVTHLCKSPTCLRHHLHMSQRHRQLTASRTLLVQRRHCTALVTPSLLNSPARHLPVVIG